MNVQYTLVFHEIFAILDDNADMDCVLLVGRL